MRRHTRVYATVCVCRLCKDAHRRAGVNNRSTPLCVSSCALHIWKNPVLLIRFFKRNQFLISRASDYGQYAHRRQNSFWTWVFIYRSVCLSTVCRFPDRKWPWQPSALVLRTQHCVLESTKLRRNYCSVSECVCVFCLSLLDMGTRKFEMYRLRVLLCFWKYVYYYKILCI